jgi:ABC-type lipoprotein release transport system permease subunit
LGGLIRSFLFDVEPWDPLTFATVPCLLVVVMVLASYFPARRASRTEPTVALRSE